MAAFQESNLHSWRGSVVLYYNIISIQLNAEIWITYTVEEEVLYCIMTS